MGVGLDVAWGWGQGVGETRPAGEGRRGLEEPVATTGGRVQHMATWHCLPVQ